MQIVQSIVAFANCGNSLSGQNKLVWVPLYIPLRNINGTSDNLVTTEQSVYSHNFNRLTLSSLAIQDRMQLAKESINYDSKISV